MANKNDIKIAIVHDYLIKIGGAERVLLEMHKVFPNAPIYTLLYDEKGTKRIFSGKGFKIITSRLQKLPKFIRNRQKLLLTKFPQAIEDFDLSDYDIVISSSNSFAHGVITRPNTLHISYCYSPMRYVWDWHHEYLAENSIGFGLVGIIIRNMLSKIRVWDKSAAERVDSWIAISKTVELRIRKYYRASANVVYSPANIKNIQPTGKKPENFYLIVSRLSPYKKIDLAIEAFNKNGKKLFIVGEGSDFDRLKSTAKNNISLLGWQSDQTIAQLYARAKAFVFPGEEDFGLTPVESMAAGRPVVAYRRGGVTESVIDGKTGVFFDEPTADSLNDAINRLELIYEKISPDACQEQAKNFSTEKFASDFEKTIFAEYEKHQKMMEKI
ncbi:MAG: glycosyltransferase [Patescibacteria group bacterium]|jgi:glycosyltransferase involved in cell wall biosynthesis